MCRISRIIVLAVVWLFSLPYVVKADTFTYVDSLNVQRYLGSDDTIWFANYNFNEAIRKEVELKIKLTDKGSLDLSGASCDYQQISPYTGKDTLVSGSVSLDLNQEMVNFPVLGEGVYRIKFTFPNVDGGPKDIVTFLFNKKIEFEIVPVQVNTDVCISDGCDTCIFTLANHRYNPKGTKYKMSSMKELGNDILVDEEKPENVQDTFLIIFNGPTGVDPMLVSVTGVYVNPRNKKVNQETKAWTESIRKFDKPNLPKIFSFDSTSVENLIGCTEMDISGMKYNEDLNRKYMDDMMNPDFESKVKYDIHYYRKDRLDGDWEEILADKEEYVADSTGFIFLKSGVYWIRMRAENMCGEDTLNTQVVFDAETGDKLEGINRLIKVYGNDVSQVEFKQDMLCLPGEGKEDTLHIFDKARRYDWEGMPDYKFIVKQVYKDQAGNDSIVELAKPEDIFSCVNTVEYPAADGNGVDSIQFNLAFKQAGIFEVVLSKQSQGNCNTVFDTAYLKVGKPPVFAANALQDKDGYPAQKLRLCGAYEYVLPLNIPIDSNYCHLTGYEWKFGKGTYQEVYEELRPLESFTFDSLKGTQTISYVTFKVQNECGWSRMDSIPFYTYGLPQVELWRDSVPGNDTLCSNRSYKYYLKGYFPENYEVIKDGGKPGKDTIYDVQFISSGSVYKAEEEFIIRNKDLSGCNDTIKGQVYIFNPPVFDVLDTVHFCENSITAINTEDVVKTPAANRSYNRLDWSISKPSGLDFVPSADSDFPSLTVPAGEDEIQLSYLVSSGGDYQGVGKGCYDRGEVNLYKHPVPVLTLQDKSVVSCEGQTIAVGSHLTSSIAEAQNLSIKINKQDWYPGADGSLSIADYTCPPDKDSAVIEFFALQQHNYPGVDGCSLQDSVKVFITHPRIVFRENDTLTDIDKKYHFKDLQASTDTSDVKNLKWYVIKGDVLEEQIVSGTDIFDWEYDFGATETPNTVLKFVLKGESYCGEEVKDTVAIFYPGAQLIGGEVTLCSNFKGQRTLWSDHPVNGYVSGFFVDKSTLTWEIQEPVQGSLSATTGPEVKYTFPEHPEGNRIQIKVSARDLTGNELTPVLYSMDIHPVPSLQLKNGFTAPLVLAGNDSLKIDQVVDLQHKSASQWEVDAKWGHIKNKGGKIIFYPAYDKKYESYQAKLEVILFSDRTEVCKNYFTESLELEIHPHPLVGIEPDTLKMCAGDQLEVGSPGNGELIVQADADVALQWKAKSGCTACLTPVAGGNTVNYTPATSGLETLYLYATKEVVNYEGENKILQAVDSVVVKAWEEPHFEVKGRRDTICYDASAVDLSHVVIINPENYTLDIQPDAGLTPVSDWHYNMAPGIDSAKIFVTTTLEGCTKWDHKKDSVVVTRLNELAVSITMDSKVCSNGELAIQGNVNTSNFTWETTNGGTLTAGNTLNPVYHPVNGVATDEIVLKAWPLLAQCSDSKEVRSSLTVVDMPVLEWQNDTICSSETSYAVQSEGIDGSMIESITWFSSSGGAFQNGINNTIAPVYEISGQDRDNGEVTLTATIILKNPCHAKGALTRQMKLTIIKTPVLAIEPGLLQPLCQGDSLDISFNSVPAPSSYQWTVSSGHLSAADVAHPRYYADGNAGQVTFSIVLSSETLGTHTCVSAPQTFSLQVKEAPAPDIVGEPTVCQEAEIVYKTNTIADVYTWHTDGQAEQSANQAVYHFIDEGERLITLKVGYANGCRREMSHHLTVLPKPLAVFKADSSIVGVDKNVHFDNRSENIEKQWWYVNRVNVDTEKNLDYTFNSSDKYQVGLEVRNASGCRDTVYQTIHAILKPKANFTVTLENPEKPCDGSLAIFTNHSHGQYVSYKWLLNTVTTGVDTMKEIPQGEVRYYASRYQDTVYQVGLAVENAAGADTAYLPVKIVSHIKARLDLVNGSTLCPGFDKEFMNYTAGTADWYSIDWGDGSDTTFTEKGSKLSVKHKYSNESYEVRQYTVKLCAGNVCGEDCEEVTVKISPNSAVAKIQVDETVGNEGCYMFEAKFHNISTGFGGTKKALWDFGEGGPLVENAEATVTNLFEKPGEYKVILKIFDECNTSLDSVKIQVKGNDQLKFNVQENIYCSGQALHLAVDPEVKDLFYEYAWNFNYASAEGSWTEVNQTEVTRTLAAGTYRVALKAKDLVSGCEVYTPYFLDMTVNHSPIADLEFRYTGEQSFRDDKEPIEGCDPVSIELKSIGAGEKDLVYWDFRDGGHSQERSLQHVFQGADQSSLKLTVISEEGCVDSLVKDYVVKKSPEAAFRNETGDLFCNDGIVRLKVENTGRDQDNTTYLWSYRKSGEPEDIFWDDKAEPIESELTDVYGKIVLRLKATDKQSGCAVENTDTILSSPSISRDIKIEKEQLCEGEEVHFHSSPKSGDEVIWDPGDASSFVYEPSFNYVYEGPGQYQVKLTVKNEYGCEEDTVRTVTVYPLPIADFSFKEDYTAVENLPEGIDWNKLPKVPNGGIYFTSHSSVPAYAFADDKLNLFWDFGDGSPVIQAKEIAHHFDNNGLYPVKLLVKTRQGCTDSITEHIAVDAVKGLFIPNAFAPGAGTEENPGVALFQPKGIGLLSYKIKIYDDPSGICVWTSDKLENGRPAEAWDGTFNGEPLPKKTYIWEVNAIFIDGSVWTGENGKTRGPVILIR